MAKLSSKPLRRVTVRPLFGSLAAGRIVACLEFQGNADVDALPVIRRLDASTYRDGIEERGLIGARFRHWVAYGKRKRWHHGWPTDPEFSMGYVFRWDHQNQHRRLYGFVVRARPDLEVCVICCFRVKFTFETEKAVKRLVRDMSQHPEVRAAIKRAFTHGGK